MMCMRSNLTTTRTWAAFGRRGAILVCEREVSIAQLERGMIGQVGDEVNS